MAEDSPPKIRTRYFQLANYNLSLCAAFIVIDTLVVLLRVLARKKQKINLQLDDWLAFPALILIISSAGVMIQSIRQHAMGYPVSTGRLDLSQSVEEIRNATRIPPRYQRDDGTGISFFFVRLFVCGTKISKMEYGFAVIDLMTDIGILLIPFPLLWRLHLSTLRKISVGLVFFLGSGAVVASAVRLHFAVYFIKKGIGATGEDGNLVVTGMMSWLQLEAFLGLFAACLPTIRILLVGLLPERVINSVMSLVSLRVLSLLSLRSERSQPNAMGERVQENTSQHELVECSYRTDAGKRDIENPSGPH